MRRMRIGFFPGRGSRGDSTRSPVVTDIRSVDDHGLFISVAEMPAAEIIHRLVVAEPVVAPVAAFVSGAAVAVPVVHAAVEAYFTAPIAATPGVRAIVPSPIARSPQQAFARWLNPCAWYPEVPFAAVGPVARRQEIAFLRADRLRIDGQFRRSDRNGRAELRAGRCRDSQNYKREEKISNGAERTHFLWPFLIILRLPVLALWLRVARMVGELNLRMMTQAVFEVCAI